MYSYEYGYDKIGNRTSLSIEAVDATTEISVDWTYEYNTLNQLKKRFTGTTWDGSNGDTRWSYEYDANGNLTQAMKEEKASGSWDEKLRWEYEWNPRDQMETAVKVENDSANHSGRVENRYCLSCDGALSERIEREAGSGEYTPIVSWQRYEYHGLDLLRVDERYDHDDPADGIDSSDPWRTLEVSSHRPGAIGSLLGKRVYTHTNNDATPDDTDDFFYTYDPVGNVVSVMDDSGNEAHHFTQEAFGNELPVNVLGGSDWDNAADDRITEHQTGKWMDEFTGLYYFFARWYLSEVGRFVARDPIVQCHFSFHPYASCTNNPISTADPTGKFTVKTTDSGKADSCCEDQKTEMALDISIKCLDLYKRKEKEDPTKKALWSCLENRCKNGTIYCRTNCPAGRAGWFDDGSWLPGLFGKDCWNDPVGEVVSGGEVHVCFGDNMATTAIHEWGHECGCCHRSKGIPNKDDYDPGGPCDWLPGDVGDDRGW